MGIVNFNLHASITKCLGDDHVCHHLVDPRLTTHYKIVISFSKLHLITFLCGSKVTNIDSLFFVVVAVSGFL